MTSIQPLFMKTTAVIWRRQVHSAFFSRTPLNYETLSRRVVELRERGNVLRSAILDYITANRKLQSINKESQSTLGNKIDHVRKSANFLDLEVNVPSSRLENDLWDFLREHWEQCVNDGQIVASFILGDSNVDTARSFQLVKANFGSSQLAKQLINPVAVLLRRLLLNNDYHNCIGLLDATYNSKEYIQKQKRTIQRRLGDCIFSIGGLAAFQHSFMSQMSLYYLLPIDCLAVLLPAYGLLKILCGQKEERISWRPYTSIIHQYLHRHEQSWMNRIITHFEELNELNVKNFHTSEVRPPPSLGVFQEDGFDMFLPSTSTLPSFNHNYKDQHTETLTKYFRDQIQKRKLNWEILKEEKTLIDFWLSHGEHYRWVEPDQDPAEICTFRSQSSNH